jgi:hypothetical protein
MLLLAICTFLPTKSLKGQRARSFHNKWAVSISGGPTQFYGELHEQGLKGVYDASLNYQFNPDWKVGLEGSIGKLVGLERYRFHSKFESPFHQITMVAHYNFLGSLPKRKNPGEIELGLLTGVGLLRFYSRAFDLTTNDLQRFTNSENSARNPLFVKWGTPKGSKRGIKFTNERAIPVGLWVNSSLTNSVRLGMQVRYYFVRTDKLDATSGNQLVNPEEADSYSTTSNDRYSHISFQVVHQFQKRKRGRAKFASRN